jgi:hypothetical protein
MVWKGALYYIHRQLIHGFRSVSFMDKDQNFHLWKEASSFYFFLKSKKDLDLLVASELFLGRMVILNYNFAGL